MAYSTISKPSLHFNTVLYTGNGSGQTISGVGFQPDFNWTKCRTATQSHVLTNAVAGATKTLFSNATQAETTLSDGLTSFSSDGYSFGSNDLYTDNSETFVSWNWKANGTGSANTDGSINSTVSANTTAGFSIVSFVGNSTSGATVGHGLSAVPKVILLKNRDTAYSWRSYFAPLGATKYIELDATAAAVTASNFMNDTAPTNTVFSLGNGDTPNKNGDNYIAYCFAEKVGYSKFGSYTGNGNADGTFVYTGFKPSFILIKNSDATQSWRLVDNKRIGFNPNNIQLYPNLNNAESTSEYVVDILSNGFKVRATDAGVNGSGNTMIYMAFAEAPLVGSNNVPCTAR